MSKIEDDMLEGRRASPTLICESDVGQRVLTRSIQSADVGVILRLDGTTFTIESRDQRDRRIMDSVEVVRIRRRS